MCTKTNFNTIFLKQLLHMMEEMKLCSKNGVKCSKLSGHIGSCNKKREVEVNRFWIKSPIMKKQKLSKELKELATLNDVAKIVFVTCNLIETKDVLEYIHGGSAGAIFGAWDFLCKNTSNEQMETLLLDYKKGKFMVKLYGHFSESSSRETMKEAVASKFQLRLSRRKFTFIK